MDNINASTAVIANMFGLTTRRIRQLVEDGVIDRVSNGNFKLEETVKQYILHLKLNANATAQLSESEADYNKENALHERAKRKKAELELALMQGSVHKGEDVETVMIDMLSRIKSKLMSIPSKMAPILGEEIDINKIQELLTDEIYMTLEELSEYSPELFRGDEYIELEDGKGDEDGEDS